MTLAEAVVALNRAGVSMYEARHVRPAWEIEALLMSAVAEAEARREMYERDKGDLHRVVPNPEGEPAPPWVANLPVV